MRPNARRAPLLLLRALLVACGVAPFVPALAAHAPLLAPLARTLDGWFAFQCERDPARMLAVGAVCARCLGLYVGLGLGALIARPRLPYPKLELLLGLAVACLLLDVASEASDLRGASATLRLLTGLVFGYFAGVLAVVRLGAPRPTGVERSETVRGAQR